VHTDIFSAALILTNPVGELASRRDMSPPRVEIIGD